MNFDALWIFHFSHYVVKIDESYSSHFFLRWQGAGTLQGTFVAVLNGDSFAIICLHDATNVFQGIAYHEEAASKFHHLHMHLEKIQIVTQKWCKLKSTILEMKRSSKIAVFFFLSKNCFCLDGIFCCKRTECNFSSWNFVMTSKQNFDNTSFFCWDW